MLRVYLTAICLLLPLSAVADDNAFNADIDHQPTGLNVELPLIDPVMWKMVWAQDFGAKKPPKGFTPEQSHAFERRSQFATIVTSIVDDERTVTHGRTACSQRSKHIRWKIITPGEYKYNWLNGEFHSEVIVEPTWDRIIRWGGSTSYEQMIVVIDGKKTFHSSCGPMEKFVFKNIDTADYIYIGNQLEWINESSEVIARFEKVSDSKDMNEFLEQFEQSETGYISGKINASDN